jgi:hypothetical protein
MHMLFLHRNDAAMRDLTHGVLELNGGVVNAEIMMKAFFHIAQNALARRGRDIRD